MKNIVLLKRMRGFARETPFTVKEQTDSELTIER
jgi:hypothetical protein